ncbi:Protein of unknown function (Porph_ging) [Elizabethkingia miricola]|nr:Protein of unknown function (Porph_ging) [Elizabethkingia miricola]
MKKIFLLCLTFITVSLWAQFRRFVYEVAMNPDSTQLVPMIKEQTLLQIQKDKSYFLSENKLRRDSLFSTLAPELKSENRKDKNKAQPWPVAHTNYNYIIEKDYNPEKIVFAENIGPQASAYTEDRPMKWTLTEDTDNISGYKVFKATCNFGGRKWIAWYTKDIQISDGPYKFRGLPGLIVKVQDDKGDYIYTLLAEEKMNNSFPLNIKEDTKMLSRLDFERQQIIFESKPQDEKQKLFADSRFSGKRGGNFRGNGGRGGGGQGRIRGMQEGSPNGEMPQYSGAMSSYEKNFNAFKHKNPTAQNPIEIGL